MRLGLRLTALAVALVVVALWFFGGPNMGWTKTSQQVERLDPVTELTYYEWEQRFLPGLDFLAAGLGAAGLLLGCSFFFRKK